MDMEKRKEDAYLILKLEIVKCHFNTIYLSYSTVSYLAKMKYG
jgi:hypothetical protein